MRGPVIQEHVVVEGELANLIAHHADHGLVAVVKQPEISVHKLNWPMEVEVAAEEEYDLVLEVHQLLFAHQLLLLLVQQLYHPVVRGLYWLLQFGGHQHRHRE